MELESENNLFGLIKFSETKRKSYLELKALFEASVRAPKFKNTEFDILIVDKIPENFRCLFF
jgi:hypothetical protein